MPVVEVLAVLVSLRGPVVVPITVEEFDATGTADVLFITVCVLVPLTLFIVITTRQSAVEISFAVHSQYISEIHGNNHELLVIISIIIV